MPKHTYWFTYILDLFPALKANAQNLGDSIIGHEHPSYRSGEPVLTAFLYIAVLLLLALVARGKLRNLDASAVPSDKLTLTTFFEGWDSPPLPLWLTGLILGYPVENTISLYLE